jgi:hypothetical protein
MDNSDFKKLCKVLLECGDECARQVQNYEYLVRTDKKKDAIKRRHDNLITDKAKREMITGLIESARKIGLGLE